MNDAIDDASEDLIKGQGGIRDAYRDATVAREYVSRRFIAPLGAHLHRQQVACVRGTIERHRPARILEIAPGPARLTVDVAGASMNPGTLVDASGEMLREARARLDAAGVSGWRLVQGDAFSLPFNRTFDLVYSFRLVRHFDRADRARLYRSVRGLLRPGGLFLFDAINERVAAPLRERHADAYQHYDAFTRPDELATELADEGFDLVALHDVQRRYRWLYMMQVLVAPRSAPAAAAAMRLIEAFPGGQPLEWVVTCRPR